jgi:hypothetical protein
MKHRWTEIEVEILKKNYCKMPRQKLQLLLPNRTLGSLSLKARNLGLCNYEGNRNWHSKLSHNKKYFEKPNTNNSYWSGFIYADGCIDKKANKLRIKISGKDLEQLFLFKKDINFTGTIREYNRSTNYGNNFYTCYIDVCGASQLLEDLENTFHITSTKSIKRLPYNLSTKEKLAFIKGLIDGDGSITKNGKRFEIIVNSTFAEYLKLFFKELSYEVCIRKSKSKDLVILYKTDIKLLQLIKSSCEKGLSRKWSLIPLESNF